MLTSVFPFLQLPSELRLQIYRLVLPYSESYEDWAPSVDWSSGICPNILYTSRKLYHEATEVLYSENAFMISIENADLHKRFPSCSQYRRRKGTTLQVLVNYRFFNRSDEVSKFQPERYRLDLNRHTKIRLVRKLFIDLPDLDLVFMGYARPLQLDDCDAVVQIGCEIHVRPWKGALDAIGKKFQQSPRLDKVRLLFGVDQFHQKLRCHALQEILKIRDVGDAKCFRYQDWSSEDESDSADSGYGARRSLEYKQLQTYERLLESPSPKGSPQATTAQP